MIQKGLVLVSVLAVGGAAFLTHDWPAPERTRLRGDFRRAGRSAAPQAPGPVVAAPAAAPEPVKPTPAKPEPPKPAVRVRTIDDVVLPVAANAQDLTFPKMSEVHVDLEGQITWHGGGTVNAMKTFKMLGDGLRQRSSDPLVLVADAQTPWQTIRFALLTAQDNYVEDVWIGAASSKEPKALRVLPLRQSPRSDDPLPTGDVFTVAVKATAAGAPEVTVQGQKLAAFPADLAAAWAAWKKAHPAAADTSSPAKTRVILEAPRSTPLAAVVAVLDVMRGIGIASERLSGQIPARPK